MVEINRAWVERLHAPRYIWSQIAALHPKRGILCREEKSQQQLLTWDVETGETHALMPPLDYTLNATLSPDGEFITYLVPHPTHADVYQYVRVPFGGGTPQPIAATALMNASPHIEEAAGRIGFTAVTGNGYIAQVWTPDGKKALFSYESDVLAYGPVLSFDGKIAVIATMQSVESETTYLEAYNIDTGLKISQLALPDTPLEAVKFAPFMGDTRLLVQGRIGLLTRPLIWDVASGAVDRLGLDQTEVEYYVWDWIDVTHLLLQGNEHEVLHFLLSYNIESQQREKLSVTDSRNLVFASRLEDHLIVIEEDITHSTSLSYSVMIGKDQNVVIFQQQYGISLYRSERSAFGSAFTTFTSWRQHLFSSQDGQFVDHSDNNPILLNLSLEDTLSFANITAWIAQNITYLSHKIKPQKNALLGVYASDIIPSEVKSYLEGVKNKRQKTLLTAHNMGAALALLTLHQDSSLWAGGVVVRPVLDWVHLYESVAPPEKAMMRLWFGGSPTEKPDAWRDASPLRQTKPLTVPVKLLYHPYDSLTPIQHIQTYAANNPTVELIDISRDMVGPAHEQQEKLITHMLEAGLPLLQKGT